MVLFVDYTWLSIHRSPQHFKTMNIQQSLQQIGKQAKTAARVMSTLNRGSKDAALEALAQALLDAEADLLAANKLDIQAGRSKELPAPMLDRLQLDQGRIQLMAEGCRQVAALPDPVGEIGQMSYQPSGIQVGKMRVPLGVIGIIYESRPNVTIDAAALCLKSGNATILRGGSEAIHTNRAIVQCMAASLSNSGLPAHAVQLIDTVDRAAVGELIKMSEFVDVIIPRGGKSLIERISREARVPVIKHLDGICHVYIDQDADIEKAHAIALNSKTHRYGVCNAMETLLVHSAVADAVLPALARAYQALDVELRGCVKTQKLLGDMIVSATEEDWDTEYLEPILSIRIVDDLAQAIEHIEVHGSAHSDSIVSDNICACRRFITEVNSSSVLVNASTRFADGFEYGLGAEIGISTDKLHVRGPVGLEGLTSQKYVVLGDGHIRE